MDLPGAPSSDGQEDCITGSYRTYNTKPPRKDWESGKIYLIHRTNTKRQPKWGDKKLAPKNRRNLQKNS